MTELNTSDIHDLVLHRRLLRSLKLRFTRHEAWVLKTAKSIPLFSLFIFGTLWIWFFLPMIPIGILSVFLIENGGIFGAVVNLVIAIFWLVLIAPWFIRWYFVCMGLMFGRTRMAKSKEEEVLFRLEQLTKPKVLCQPSYKH